MANLEGSLTTLDAKLEAGGAPSSARAELAELLMMRAQFLGRLSDTERAAGIADALVQETPRSGTLILLRGRTRAALHLFPQALRDFDEAARIGADGNAITAARASVLLAIGRVDEAIALRAALAAAKPDILSLGALAVAQGEGGDLVAASATFGRARGVYRDVSPFPLAWTYFQEGKLYFAAGELDRARELFATAVDQLPSYAAAAGHLGEVEAAMGLQSEAAQRLRVVAASTEDPDSEGHLCLVLRDMGQSPEAESCRIRVSELYESLLKRHPEAFWDHAAEFFLAMHEPHKALVYARQNLALRPSRAAFDLFAKTAAAAGAASEASSVAKNSEALASHHSPGGASHQCAKAGPASAR
jgi:tetratricopeptide (TPR) repeat protein